MLYLQEISWKEKRSEIHTSRIPISPAVSFNVSLANCFHTAYLLAGKKNLFTTRKTLYFVFFTFIQTCFIWKSRKPLLQEGGEGKEGEDRGRRGKPLKIIYLLFHFLHNARRKSKTFLKKLFLEQEEKKIKISFFHQKE